MYWVKSLNSGRSTIDAGRIAALHNLQNLSSATSWLMQDCVGVDDAKNCFMFFASWANADLLSSSVSVLCDVNNIREEKISVRFQNESIKVRNPKDKQIQTQLKNQNHRSETYTLCFSDLRCESIRPVESPDLDNHAALPLTPDL